MRERVACCGRDLRAGDRSRWAGFFLAPGSWFLTPGLVPASDGFERSSVEVRAFGGCLGAKRRGRTWHAAKSREERRALFDPRISEWGNPPRA